MIVDSPNSLLLPAMESGKPVLHLLGGLAVTVHGRRVEVPEGSKRLLVFVALRRRAVERRYAAGALWPCNTDTRAAGNLRSALWRLKAAGLPLLAADKKTIAMSEDVLVDVHVVGEWAARVIRGNASSDDLAVRLWDIDSLDLLPGWYDDWAIIERERVRQRILHALESLSRELVRLGRCAEAVETAIVAVGVEPLRETAQQALIEAHLAEGNRLEGRREYEAYRSLLHCELGTDPDPRITALVSHDVLPGSYNP
jgi:DNA-binding SARP family transcriptional activator